MIIRTTRSVIVTVTGCRRLVPGLMFADVRYRSRTPEIGRTPEGSAQIPSLITAMVRRVARMATGDEPVCQASVNGFL